MTSKNSSSSTETNKSIWIKNLPSSSKPKRDANIPFVEKLSSLTRMPNNRQILGNFAYLFNSKKQKQDRIRIMISDIELLWKETLDFPLLSRALIRKKLNHLIDLNTNNKKNPSEKFDAILSELFDVTNVNGEWKSSEDKEFYQRQKESGGKVGYSTVKQAPPSSMHPRKRARAAFDFPAETHDNIQSEFDSDSSSESPLKTLSSSSSSSPIPESPQKHKRENTEAASLLVRKVNISTHRAHDVLLKISEYGYNVPAPSQSGIWRRVIKEGQEIKNKIIEKLQNEELYCLHFDGKRIKGKEFQVVLLNNAIIEIKLGVLECENGSAKAIYNELQKLINEYDAWKNIGMIISDTTAVNTGRFHGIVKLIQDTVIGKGYQKPQYIGCQHHVLDLLLKHVMNFIFQESTTKPELSYSFIDEIVKSYESLKDKYKQVAVDILNTDENPGWRDDFKFLYELCQGYRYYKATSQFPIINWKKLPNLHQARWNSRAIYAVIAFFLLPDRRPILGTVCDFISFEWADAWFHTQHYNETIFNKLLTSLQKTKCEKAIKCLETNWNLEESVIDIPRSNQIAERAVKLMEELHSNSKKLAFLNLKFIGKNNF